MESHRPIVEAIRAAYPDAQAVYRFGSWGTACQRAESDLDIAVLLPWRVAERPGTDRWVELNGEISAVARTDRVDLVNLRVADTVLQAEVLRGGAPVYSADEGERLAFEVLVLSKYDDLNRWREPLIEEFLGGAPAS